MDKGETYHEALMREVKEETGLIVRPESIREIGEVIEVREDIYKAGVKYIAHSYHYYCDVEDEVTETSMTESELRRGYHLAWESIDEIIRSNETNRKDAWVDRDTTFLKWLKDTGEK